MSEYETLLEPMDEIEKKIYNKYFILRQNKNDIIKELEINEDIFIKKFNNIENKIDNLRLPIYRQFMKIEILNPFKEFFNYLEISHKIEREKQKIFALDFQVLYPYLYYDTIYKEKDVGYIFYLMDNDNYKYTLMPLNAVEYYVNLKMKVEKLIKISNYKEAIDNKKIYYYMKSYDKFKRTSLGIKDAEIINQLNKDYYNLNNYFKLILLLDDAVLKKYHSSYKRFVSLRSSKKILPMEMSYNKHWVDDLNKKYPQYYSNYLTFVNIMDMYRIKKTLNNKTDALCISLSYGLNNTYDDTFVTYVSSTPTIHRIIKDKNIKKISFINKYKLIQKVPYLALKNYLINNDLSDIEYIYQGKKILNTMDRNIEKAPYLFPKTEKIRRNNIIAGLNLLNDYKIFYNEYYKKTIKPLLAINATYTNSVKKYEDFEIKGNLAKVFEEKEIFENNVQKAIETVENELKHLARELTKNFVNESHYSILPPHLMEIAKEMAEI